MGQVDEESNNSSADSGICHTDNLQIIRHGIRQQCSQMERQKRDKYNPKRSKEHSNSRHYADGFYSPGIFCNGIFLYSARG